MFGSFPLFVQTLDFSRPHDAPAQTATHTFPVDATKSGVCDIYGGKMASKLFHGVSAFGAPTLEQGVVVVPVLI